MANILKKQFKEYPAGTQVKVHDLDTGTATISVPPFNKKYLIPAAYLTRGPATHTAQDVHDMYMNTHTVSPGRPSIPQHDWSKLDAMPITYESLDQAQWPIRVECYCGKSFAYYKRADIATQANERAAVDATIASCEHCTAHRATKE